MGSIYPEPMMLEQWVEEEVVVVVVIGDERGWGCFNDDANINGGNDVDGQ